MPSESSQKEKVTLDDFIYMKYQEKIKSEKDIFVCQGWDERKIGELL